MENTIPIDETTKNKSSSSKVGVWYILSKFGLKVISLLAKFSKLFLAGASFAAYSYMFTWQFAIMLLSMIFIHEYGHFYAMKMCKMKTKGIYLIPFFGGAAVADEDFKSRYDEAFIAMMGPWFGLACSIVTGSLYFVTDNPLFAAGGAFMAMINLLNLLPVNPLDGGRVLKSLTFSIHDKLGMVFLSLGIILMIIIAIFLKSVTFVILLLIASLDLFFEYKRLQKQKMEIDSYNNAMNKFTEDKNINLTLLQRNEMNNEFYSKFFVEKPKMTTKQILLYLGLYILTSLVFVYTIYVFKHIPGADAAAEVLK